MGRSHAVLLAARGASVVVNDVAAAHATAVTQEIRAAGGAAIAHVRGIDTTDGARSCVRAARVAVGRVDLGVCHAGSRRSADVADRPDDLWDEVLGVNLRGAFLVARAAWEPMRDRGFGRIVLTTSNSGLLGVPGSSAYAASKAGLWGLTRVLALEGADRGIHTNAVAPVAYTEMSATSRLAPPAWRDGEGDAWSARLDPAAVSPVVAWLGHEACTLNGEVLSAAGGRVARFFIALTPGVVDDALTIESVRDHESEIVRDDGYEVPGGAAEETRQLHRRLMR
jgi:NAD(P)-dependent dehydrogenase (short-subunit alcohol dehydrogenase family)